MSNALALERVRERTDWLLETAAKPRQSAAIDWLQPTGDPSAGTSQKATLIAEIKATVAAGLTSKRFSFRSSPKIVDLGKPYAARGLDLREDGVEALFEELADRWVNETRFVSALETQVLNDAYQRIIGLGPKALPLILNRLRTHGGNWFWALRAISGHDPIRAEDYGNVQKMKEAWLEWAAYEELLTD
jgi:hypothetical protein